MNRYFIQLAFSGTKYHGWQIQKNAHSVQAELNKSIETVLREKIETMGCGRTDTGVHATQFFAHFDSVIKPEEFDKTKIIFKLNSILPKDIAVHNIFPVGSNANARFDAISRTYKYLVHYAKNPFFENRSYQRGLIKHVEEMNRAAGQLLKVKDFSCFSKSHTQVKTNICRVYKAGWSPNPMMFNGSGLIFEIKADRFLRNMVRAIVGTLLQVGDGELSLGGFKKILESKNRSKAGISVPACGLYLTEVNYSEELLTEVT